MQKVLIGLSASSRTGSAQLKGGYWRNSARQPQLALAEPCTALGEASSPHSHAMRERALAWKRSRAFASHHMHNHSAAQGHHGGAWVRWDDCSEPTSFAQSGSRCRSSGCSAERCVPGCTKLSRRLYLQLLLANAAGQCATRASVQRKRRLGPPRCLSQGDVNF